MKVKLFSFLVMAITISNLHGQFPFDTSLVAYWPFNANAFNESGNGYNGIVYGAVVTSDRFGIPRSAFDFAGGDRFINFGNILNNVIAGYGKKFSISAWIKPDTSMNNNIIIAKSADDGCDEDHRQFKLRIFPHNKLSFTFISSLTEAYYRRVITYNEIDDTSKWYHIAVTYDGTISTNDGMDRVNLYINSDKQDTYLDPQGPLGDIQFGETHLGIGNFLTPYGNSCQDTTSFEGKIDDVRIYDCVLDSSAIRQLYEEPNPAVDGLTIDSTSSWIGYEWYTDIGMCSVEFYNKIYFKGDTVINDTTYYRMYKSGKKEECWHGYGCEGWEFFKNIYAGSILEIEEKIIAVLPNDSVSCILYDFSYSINDTIKSEIGKGLIIQDIDTLPDGRKKFITDNPDFHTIEGIGGSLGLLIDFSSEVDYCGGLFDAKLGCYYQNDKLIFVNDMDICNVDLPQIVLTKIEALNIKIYPNPAKEDITVDLGQLYNEVTLTVKNILGQNISSLSFGLTDRINYKLKGPKGLYLIEIYTREGKTAKFKVIKD